MTLYQALSTLTLLCLTGSHVQFRKKTWRTVTTTMWIRSFLVKGLAAAMQAEVWNVEIGWKQSVNIFLVSKFLEHFAVSWHKLTLFLPRSFSLCASHIHVYANIWIVLLFWHAEVITYLSLAVKSIGYTPSDIIFLDLEKLVKTNPAMQTCKKFTLHCRMWRLAWFSENYFQTFNVRFFLPSVLQSTFTSVSVFNPVCFLFFN